MAQALSFSSSGSIPTYAGMKKSIPAVPFAGTNTPKPAYQAPSSTNISKPGQISMNPMGDPSQGIIGTIGRATGLDTSTPKMGSNPGMIAPSTPVKKINNVDGSSTEFHAPEKKAEPEQTSAAPKVSGMVMNAPAETGPAKNPYAPGNSSQGGFIGNVAAAGQSTPEENYWKDQYQKSVAGTQFGNLAPYAEAGMNVGKTPEELQGLITAPDLAGRASGDTGLYKALGGAYGNAALAGLSAAQTTAARNLQANTSAASLTAPTSQFGMLTNQQTGQIVGGDGSTASGVMSSALKNAISMYNSGASLQDIMSTSGLATFGVLGQTAFLNAISQGGGFNPTAYNTEVGANQTNLAGTQNEAFSLNKNLQQVEKLAPVVTDFLKNSGINPFDAQMYNGPVNDYLKKIGNSGAATQWAAMMGDLKNFTSQILASGYGGTPTGTEKATLDQDPSQLSYGALQAYLQTLRDLGGNRLATLQDNIKSLGGTGVGYTGSPAQTATSTKAAAPGSGELGTGATSPIGMLTAGLLLDKVPDIVNGAGKAVAQGLGAGAGSKVLSYILAP